MIAPTPGSGGSDPGGWLPSASVAGTSVDDAIDGAMQTAGKAMKVGRGCSIAVSLVVVLGIIGGIVFAVTAGKEAVNKALKSVNDDIALSGSGRVIASGGGNPSEIAVVVQHYSGGTHRYVARVKVSRAGFDEVWRSPELPDDAYGAPVVVVGDTVFTGFGDQLWALSLATGQKKWETTLRNSLTSGCEECLASVEGKVIVRTNDAYLVGYGTESDEPLWSRRLTSTVARPSIIGGHYYIVDDSPEQGQPSRVHSVNPANGQDRRSVAPICKDTESFFATDVDPSTRLLAVPGTKDLVAAFGFGDVCVARWEAATGRIRYTARIQNASSIDQDETVIGPSDLVVSTSSQMYRVSLADGRSTPLAPSVDQTATPAAITGRILVAATVTSRGDTKGGYAGWSLDTGRLVWNLQAPSGAQPASPVGDHTSDALFEGSPRAVLAGAGTKLHIVVFDGASRHITIQDIDPATGSQGARRGAALGTDSDLGTPSLSVEAVGVDLVVYTVENHLRVLDIATGNVHRYPSDD